MISFSLLKKIMICIYVTDSRHSSNKRKRKKWSEAEKDACRKHFKKNIAMLQAPRRSQCELAIHQETMLTKITEQRYHAEAHVNIL